MEKILELYKNNHPIYDLTLNENEELTIISFNDEIKDANLDLKINQKDNSVLNIYNIISTSTNALLKQIVNVEGRNCNTNIISLFLSLDNANINSYIEINHLNKESKSLLETYVLSKDSSIVKLDNIGRIKNGCHKVSVRQKAKGLTLSKESHINASPILYIDDYDVEASHACAIGSVNKEDLFYLMSRGLNEQEARKLIVLGFIMPIIDRINNDEITKEINKSIIKKI